MILSNFVSPVVSLSTEEGQLLRSALDLAQQALRDGAMSLDYVTVLAAIFGESPEVYGSLEG